MGYFLDHITGYRGAQMGPALSDPRLLLPAGGEHGRPGAAGAGAAAGAADRGRAQPDRRGYAVRPLLGLHRGRAQPAFRAMLYQAIDLALARGDRKSVA